jgi:hypothetical protein
MLEANGVSIEIVALPDGKFAVRAAGAGMLEKRLGEFDTRAEAESCAMDYAMTDSGLSAGARIMKPGDGQGLR